MIDPDWERAKERVDLRRASGGRYVAFLQVGEGGIPLMATGGSRREAIQNMRERFHGRTPKNEPPMLRLCRPCNELAARAGDAAHRVGVLVCGSCTQAIDRWNVDIKLYRARVARRERRRRTAKCRR
jgi:hypothetical protein